MHRGALRTQTKEIELTAADSITALLFYILCQLQLNAVIHQCIVYRTAFQAAQMIMLTDIGIITEAVLSCIQNLDNIDIMQNFYGFYTP